MAWPRSAEAQLMSRIILPPLDPAIAWLLRAMALCLPLSVKLYSPGADVEIIFLAELLIGSVFLLAVVAFLSRRTSISIDKDFLKHPITWVVTVYLFASIVAALFSTMPVVSAKALLVRVAYLAVFYFLIGSQPLSSATGAPALLKLYAVAFLPVVLFSFANQIGAGLDRAGSGFASFPFYTDHTIYAAALVFVLIQFGAAGMRALGQAGGTGKTALLLSITFILLVSLYFSFCRAAWVSVAVASPIVLALLARRTAYRIALLAGVAVLVVGVAWGDRLGKSTVDANAYGSGARASILSLTNTATDPSNMERINRWSCAWRMFRDKPVTGFGPGTYQFQYLDYQLPEEVSPLSIAGAVDPGLITRSVTLSKKLYVRSNPQVHQYSGGTAHSEYLLALSESGALACAALAILMILAVATGVRMLRSTADPLTRSLVATATMGVGAYAVHAVFNNFLDDCKVAFLFWALLALLTRLDLQRRAAKQAR